MSFLFHRRTQKIAKFVWGIVAVLIILGMVVFFAPGDHQYPLGIAQKL